MPLLVVAVFAVAAAFHGDRARPDPADGVVERTTAVSKRVEEIRSLRFRELPTPEVISNDQAREEGAAELRRSYPRRERLADEEVLKLLGLLEPGADLQEIGSEIYGGQVAGFYDTRKERLAVVSGAKTGSTEAELTLAHELTHALEDQRFSLRDDADQDDRALAYQSLVEGTATGVMVEYLRRHLSSSDALTDLLSGAGAEQASLEKLPPYVRAQLTFPYESGAGFVERLLREGGGGWTLVDAALSERPPVSSEQILHPDVYLRGEEPDRVALDVGGALGDGWRRRDRGSLGEFDARQLLASAGRANAERAAQGWGGGRFELWQRGSVEGCDAPCRDRDVLAVGFRWDSARDAREFEQVLEAALQERGARPDGVAQSLAGGAVATRRTARTTALVFAPDPELADRLTASIASGDG
ncbi:MAG: hypothetical protein ACR2NA_13300 [Solirubrobacterales bacterium]